MRWIIFVAAFSLTALSGGLTVAPAAAQAQMRGTSTRRPRAPRPARTTVNGSVSAVTASGITLTTDDSKLVSALLLPTTQISRSREKTGQNFVSGDKVVARLATYSDGRVTLVQIWDVDAHQEEQIRRRTITVGKVIELRDLGRGSADLIVEAPDDQVTFRVTPKTVWFKADALVAPSAFPIGTSVAVRPRALPSGGIMAGIVADTANTAEAAYRDTLSVWRGKVTGTDGGQFFLTLLRDDNATRTVWVPPTLTIGDEKDRRKKSVGRRYKLSELTGCLVVVRIQKNAPVRPDGKRTVGELTVTAPAPATVPAKVEDKQKSGETPVKPEKPVQSALPPGNSSS